jgi:hypothetical protein
MRTTTLFLAVALSGFSAATAAAQCAPDLDAQGSWRTYANGALAEGGAFVRECLISIGRAGRVHSGSGCFSDGPDVRLTGELRMRACNRFRGNLTLRNAGPTIACRVRGALSPNSETGAGVANCGRNGAFTFTMIRPVERGEDGDSGGGIRGDAGTSTGAPGLDNGDQTCCG